MKVSDLYLSPPTFGELSFAASRLDDYLEALLALRDLNQDEAGFSLFSSRFEIPPEFRKGMGHDDDLASLIATITDGTSYNFSIPKQAGYERELAYYERLRPETTFKAGNGDCKSLAVIAVAYKRLHGIPARFLLSNEHHIIFEEHDGQTWIPKEPQMACFSLPLTELVEPIEPIPNSPLYDRLYLEALRLYSGVGEKQYLYSLFPSLFMRRW